MKEINIGSLEFYNEIEIGDLQLDVKNVYPELEKVTVQSRIEEQIVKPTKYGFSEITVKPMEIKLQDKTITDNGVYSADSEYDGLRTVTVDTEDAVINKYFDTNIVNNMQGISKYIKKIPELDLSNTTSANSLFNDCASVVEFPELDTAHITNMYQMFRGCTSLQKVLNLDCTNCTNMSAMFYSDPKLEEVSVKNATKVESLTNMFWNCAKLKRLSGFDNMKPTTIAGVFGNCNSLGAAPKLDTSECTRFNMAFQGNLYADMPALEAGKATSITNIFNLCGNIVNFGGMHDLGKAYDSTKAANFTDYGLTMSASAKMTHESILNIFNGLYDIKSLGVKTQQVVIGPKNVAKVTPDEIKIATDKGWSVS